MAKVDVHGFSQTPSSPEPSPSLGPSSSSSSGLSSSGEKSYKNPFYNSSKPTNAINSPKATIAPFKITKNSFETSTQDYGANLAAAESALEQARNNMYGATDPFSEAELRKEFEAAQANYDEAKRQAQENAHRFMQQAAKDIAEQQGLPDISNLSQQSIAQGPQPMQELIPGRGQKPVYDNTLARAGNWLGESVKAGGLGAAAGYTGTARVAQEASEEAQIARNFDSATEAAWSLAKEYASQLSDPETAEERNDAIFRFETELKGFCDALGDGVYEQVVANAKRAAEEIIKPETDLDELYNNFNSGVSVDETNFQKATKATSELANELSAMSEESTETAKEIIAPLKIGGVLTDATINAVQMAIDGAISTAAVSIGGFNAATKGAIGLGSMFTRAAGSKAQQAEAAGASFNQQVAAAALSGGVEVLTEKLADGLAGLYGKGTSDEIVNEIIRKLCSNDQGRAALSFLANGASEAIEEVLSGAAEPAIDSIYNEDAKKAYTTSEGRKELISDIGYSALIGFILGEAGGTVEAATGGVAETVEQMRETDAVQNNLVENGMSEKDARKAAPVVVKALSNEGLTKAQKKTIANPIAQSVFGEQIDAAKAAAQNATTTASTTPAPAPEQAQAEGRTAPAQTAIETATEEMATPVAAQPTQMQPNPNTVKPAPLVYEGGTEDDVAYNVAKALAEGRNVDVATAPFRAMLQNMDGDELSSFVRHGIDNYIDESYASFDYEETEKQAKKILHDIAYEEYNSANESKTIQDGKTYTPDDVRQVFRNLSKDPDISNMAEKVFDVAKKFGINLQADAKWDKGAVYDNQHRTPKTIFANPSTVNGVSEAGRAQMLLHEYIHSVSTYLMTEVNKYSALFGNNAEDAPSWYKENITPEMENAVKTIYDVYSQLAEDPSFKRHVSGTFNYDLSKSDGEHYYGAENAMEMVAELSNPNFRQYLEQKSVLQKIIDAVKALFGIRPSNALDTVSTSFDYILTHANEEAFNQYSTNPEITQNDLLSAIHARTDITQSAPQPEAAQPEGRTAAAPAQGEVGAAQPINEAEEVASEVSENSTNEGATQQSPEVIQTEESTQAEQQEESAKEEQPGTEQETTEEEQAESETESESDENVPPEEPTGEPTGATYEELAEEYGIIEPGEKPTREANTPKRTAESNKVSESTRTVIEAGVTPESRLSDIKTAVSEGRFSYIPIKNSDIAADARARVEAKGWRKAVTDWTNAIREGKASAELVAEGAVILNNAANNEECSGAEYIDLMVDYVRLNRAMGRGLQAARILKTLSPEGKLYAFQRVVENMNDDISEMQKNLGKNYTIPQDLVEEYRNQTTDEGRDAVIDKMQKAIAAQMPSTFADKLTALRYLNMLGNLKTQVRNILGNTGMMAVQKAKNILRAGIETVASAATGGKIEKQASAFYGRDLARAAFNDFRSNQDVQAEGMGERKYSSPSQEYIRGISENKEVFKYGDNKLTRALGIAGKQGPVLKALSLYQKGTTWAMEMGDQVFVTLNYTDALAGYLQAHKITAEQWKSLVAEAEADPTSESAETVDKARSYAIKQAQEATFRDSNKISEFAQNFDKNWGKMGIITQGIAPFRKTPANVGVRMEEYSPLGIANTIVKGIQAAKGKNNVTGSDVIDSLSKAMTGTGLAYLGWMLAAAGKARTRSDDDDQEAFDKLRGLQDYSVTINGTNYTLDWAVPAAAALFMGVEGYNNLMDGNLTGDELMQVLGNLTSPMLQMSMLSGLNDALNNLSSFNDDTDALPQFLLNSAWSYLTQGFTNTMLGQIEQANEKYRQTYYTKSESKIPTSAQKKLAQAGNKTPGIDFQSADYIDAWGRKVENPSNPVARYLNALLNPSYVSNLEKSSTEVDDELQRLYEYGKDQDRFPDVFPKRTSRSTSVNGTKLSPEEYDTYATTKGQKSLELVSELIGSKAYESLSDDAKAEAISECYSFARYIADKEIADGRGEDYTSDYETLLTGVDKSGAAYDKTGLNESNFTAYTAFKTGVKDAVDKQDYEALDKLVLDYKRQNSNLKTVLSERDAMLRALTKWSRVNLDSKTYYDVQKELVNSQRKLDKSQKTGSAVELDALANVNLPEATKKRLIDSLDDYGSKTVKGVYDVLYDYGFNSKQINEFWNNSQDWIYKDTKDPQSSQKQGTLQNDEAAYAIMQLPGLTDQQMSDIYYKLKEVAHNPYKINDWGTYSFSSEKNYVTSGRSKKEYGASQNQTSGSADSKKTVSGARKQNTETSQKSNLLVPSLTSKTNQRKANPIIGSYRTP